MPVYLVEVHDSEHQYWGLGSSAMENFNYGGRGILILFPNYKKLRLFIWKYY